MNGCLLSITCAETFQTLSDLDILPGYPTRTLFKGIPGGSDGEESTCGAGVLGLIPGWGRSPGEGSPLQHSGLENSMDRGAWQATDHGVTKEQHYQVTEHAQLAHTILFKRVSPKMLIAEGWYDSSVFLKTLRLKSSPRV